MIFGRLRFSMGENVLAFILWVNLACREHAGNSNGNDMISRDVQNSTYVPRY